MKLILEAALPGHRGSYFCKFKFLNFSMCTAYLMPMAKIGHGELTKPLFKIFRKSLRPIDRQMNRQTVRH